ncbi:ABC transporter ATP-binding protein [Clostridium sp. NSJ-6]|uniref:ABC transporter ATP-binding protein n=1 Tax=Clostridium hominis TaxID=2763036 RepID=A0ABR7DE53_9CLOT|nr:ABC transporter ATP-binding protein [Clostridium hominis]MBC5629676.1 ABC transporter ATP-binding protein [Clostridium hominis]MDU2673541.1 ABC transporter ATP-binding protein [Clostridium sp.]
MNNIITLKDVNKSYSIGENSLHVLKDINFTVEKGDFIAILGASGSGKSTLMNIIGCMDTTDTGEYFIEDIAIHQCDDNELAKVRNSNIGFIFQKYHLIPQYNILQNVMMPLLIRGMSRNEAMKIAKENLRRVGLEDRIEHRPNELSGGQQQRVAIARALVTKPALLLADEPTGALDSTTGREILSLFKELNKAGNTIIMITHDANVAKESNKILYLDDGILSK